ncbi:hypothetical protein GCM10009850_087720 [Nonomuraea monospora]|uniref:Histidine kinase/HSP90-like ATPase domain-containing protein n=1 Tax=Nonomuraea monospora TaxID=568818 RepID=A0ABN3CVD9_9ACTN
MDHRTQYLSDEPRHLDARWVDRQLLGEEFPDLAPGLVMSTFGSRPVWGGMAWRQAFAGRADQVAPAQRMVGRLLADTGRGQDAERVTAELATNALRHSCSGHSCAGQARGFFVVELLRGAGVARIVVYDLGGGSVPDFSPAPGSGPGLAGHGRGLAGVAELAVRCGVAGDASTGHAIWAELALPGEEMSAPAPAATAAGDSGAAGAGARGPGGSRAPLPVDRGGVAEEAGRVAAGCGLSWAGGEGAAGEEPGGLADGLPVSAEGPGSGRGEAVGGLDPFAGVGEGW